MNHAETFERLKTLVGRWSGTTDTGRTIDVAYKLVANNTVLVETWELAPQRESLTLYHMDNGKLIATHYCPIGNQPRLELQDGRDETYTFAFVSASNLPAAGHARQTRFELRLKNDGTFWRSETYTEENDSISESADYVRTPACHAEALEA